MGKPLRLTPQAKRNVRKALAELREEKGHRNYNASEVAARTGYPLSSILEYFRVADKEFIPITPKRPGRKIREVEKPEFVRDVEKATGLKAFPFHGDAEWRLMSPTGVLLMILIGSGNLLHAVEPSRSLSSLQGITWAERCERKTVKKGKKSQAMELDSIVDKLVDDTEDEEE